MIHIATDSVSKIKYQQQCWKMHLIMARLLFTLSQPFINTACSTRIELRLNPSLDIHYVLVLHFSLNGTRTHMMQIKKSNRIIQSNCKEQRLQFWTDLLNHESPPSSLSQHYKKILNLAQYFILDDNYFSKISRFFSKGMRHKK